VEPFSGGSGGGVDMAFMPYHTMLSLSNGKGNPPSIASGCRNFGEDWGAFCSVSIERLFVEWQ
jgi:hypothetical protein